MPSGGNLLSLAICRALQRFEPMRLVLRLPKDTLLIAEMNPPFR